MAYDVSYAVALRAVVLFLLVLAWEEFTKMQEGSRPAPIVVVAAVIVLATLEVGVARWLQRPTRRTPTAMRTVSHGLRKRGRDLRAAVPASIAFALPAAGIAVLLAGGLIVIVAPFLAMALFPNTANIVLGTIVVFFAFQVLLAVGKWRWSAWDERERIETQERGFETGSNWAVGTQMTIHMLAGILLYVGIVRADYAIFEVPLIVLAIALAGVAVLLGIGIDVVAANRRRNQHEGERVVQYMS